MRKWMSKEYIDSWIEMAAAILVVVTLVLGMTGHAMPQNTNFALEMVWFVAGGVALTAAGFFIRWDFWPFLPGLCYFFMIGMVFYRGATVIADHVNGIQFSGGSFSSLMLYFTLLLIASLLCVVAAFVKPVVPKKEK